MQFRCSGTHSSESSLVCDQVWWSARLLLLFTIQASHSTDRKDVRLPVQLQRAMAAEAEAAREARAKVIAAEGEQKASRALREASEVIGDSPAALQLRYLQVNSSNLKINLILHFRQ